MSNGSTFATAKAKLRMAEIVEVAQVPMTVIDIADLIGISSSMVCRYVNHMVAQSPKQLRICGWMDCHRRGRKVPMYKKGSGRNVPEPPRITASERHARVKADAWRYQLKLASWRRAYHKKKGQTPPIKLASPFAALGL